MQVSTLESLQNQNNIIDSLASQVVNVYGLSFLYTLINSQMNSKIKELASNKQVVSIVSQINTNNIDKMQLNQLFGSLKALIYASIECSEQEIEFIAFCLIGRVLDLSMDKPNTASTLSLNDFFNKLPLNNSVIFNKPSKTDYVM